MLFSRFHKTQLGIGGHLFKELIEEIGVKGAWNDMNEPAVMEVPNKTFPDDVRHDYDGNPCSHRGSQYLWNADGQSNLSRFSALCILNALL